MNECRAPFSRITLTTAGRARDQIYIWKLPLQAIFLVHHPGSCDAHLLWQATIS